MTLNTVNEDGTKNESPERVCRNVPNNENIEPVTGDDVRTICEWLANHIGAISLADWSPCANVLLQAADRLDAISAARVTAEMVNAGWNEGKNRSMTGLPSDFRAVLEAALSASSVAMPVEDVHPDDIAVDRFAVAMKEKLAKKRSEGRGGWDNPDECTAEYLSYLLVQHILKGDPLDVGNLAMMLHQRGDRIVIDEEAAAIFPKAALAQPAQGWRDIASAPNGQEVLIAYWRWRNSMSPGTIIVQSAMRTELHGPGIWSWVVSDNKHGPFPIRGWSDGDIIGWMPLPAAPAPAGGADHG